MQQIRLNPEKKRAISVKFLELKELKLHQQEENVQSKRKVPQENHLGLDLYQNPGPKEKPKRNNPKKPIVCFKCGKPGHKSFQCKTEQKINELFSGDPELKQKIHALLINQSEAEPEDCYSESSSDSEYESSPIPTINVITNKSQKEFLLDLIGQIPDGDLKKRIFRKIESINS